MKNKIDTKVCGVCGDKALGYNFNAVTCESCKAFFRRNALVQKEFRCPFTNDCKITTITRRFCQKCRLDKCNAIGMCKDLIMSDADKAQKRQKIEENRAKKRSSTSRNNNNNNKRFKNETVEADSQDSEIYTSSYHTDSDTEETASISDSVYQPINNNPNTIDSQKKSKENLTINEENVTSSSSTTPPSFQSIFLNNLGQIDQVLFNAFLSNNNNNNNNIESFELESSTIKNNLQNDKDITKNEQKLKETQNSTSCLDSILSAAIKLEYSYSSINSLSQNNSSHSRELNDAEREKLNELILANKALLTPVEEELSPFGNEFKNIIKNHINGVDPQLNDSALLDVINLTAIAIRRLIKMAKKISAFKNMCQEDQVALLKGGCTEIMMIISARRYDSTRNSWKIPSIQESLNVNVNVLKLAKGNAYQELAKFIKTFDPKWRHDENIILILCAIVLFTPDRPRVIHDDVIKLEQNSYYYLLRRYLESTYSGCEAKSIFLKLIQKIMELHKVNEEIVNVFLDVNPSQVEPLLIEMFDIK